MNGAIPPLPQFAFMAWCSVKAQRKIYLLPLPFNSKSMSSGPQKFSEDARFPFHCAGYEHTPFRHEDAIPCVSSHDRSSCL
jgi:hypothetical protein